MRFTTLFQILQLLTFSSTSLAIPLGPQLAKKNVEDSNFAVEQALGKRGNVVTVTATINGVQATWLQTVPGAGTGAATTAAAGENDATSTRTHYITKTISNKKNRKSKRDTDSVYEEPEVNTSLATSVVSVDDALIGKHHRHLDKRNVVPVTATFDGKAVTWMQTVAGGDDSGATTNAAAATSSKTSVKTSAVAAAVSSSPAASAANSAKNSATAAISAVAKNVETTSSAKSSSSSSSSSSGNDISGDLKAFSNPTTKFKDGTIKCSNFPSGQGVIKVPWAGLGGWTSIQKPSADGSTSTKCTDGWLCSYACQAGMLKTQWPSSQPSDGQSRGGLLCKNGYLYRTNTKLDYLCEWGHKSAYAVSKLNKVLSLCRTDYPGSENMNIPTRVAAKQTQPISVVDGSTYYQWEGKTTSAQYYVNDAGVDVEKGCVWGTSSGTIGNWAPVVLGAGYSSGQTWLLLIPNPNNKKKPNYNIKIEAASGGTISGSCSYVDGKYSGGSGSDGCTVAVTKGAANFVFS